MRSTTRPATWQKTLIGGQAYHSCSDDSSPSDDDSVWSCATGTTVNESDSTDDVVYTDDEIDDNDALVVRAKSDGDEQSVNLYLSETDRLRPVDTKAYLRLTDSNGDGRQDEDTIVTTEIEDERKDWGYQRHRRRRWHPTAMLDVLSSASRAVR